MNWLKANRIVAAIVLIVTTIIYTLTVAPTVSFWDCGEFIATAYKMSVPHPPGSPLFLLVGRIFTLLPFPEDIGLRVNLISVLSSSFTVMLLYLVIVQLFREWKGKLESQEDWLTAIGSGLIGSLTFAFTHSFWFNSSEAEVYAASMLFTALLIWLSLIWAERSEEVNNEKYLLMIAYLIGLAIAVHLLNVLALPFVAMMYYYKRYEFHLKSFLIMTGITVVAILFVYPGVVKYFPLIAKFGVFWLFAVFAVVMGLAYWAVNNHRHLISFAMLSVTLILIGYSSYSTIFIRSGLDPVIDENDPETVERFLKYINREQYGDHSFDREKGWRQSPNANRYSSASEFFWDYQVNHMYYRYFMWQFVGMDEVSGNWNWQFLGIPLLLGLIGMVYHFRGDPKHSLAVLALFFATGLAIILYLNQPDPQPRERDYSYVGSFFAFAIWIGFGYAGIIEAIREALSEKSAKAKKIALPIFASVFLVLMIISPIQLLAKNYHSHNRSGNYVAWDYSYNILMSCEKDGILFTNGDNDTFPLWYLQEVEELRTDVRIVNLSLLNTDWYIEQLRDMEPKVPMQISEAYLKQVSPIPWEKREVTLKVPEETYKEAYNEFKTYFGPSLLMEKPKEIKFQVSPTLVASNYKLLRTQDYMILNILAANQWKKPVYFATTVPQSNLVGGLQDYMRMEGLVMRVVPFKNWRISPDILEVNLTQKYQYRFDDPDVYYNPSITGLLQNYRTPFIALGEYYAGQNNTEKIREIFDFEAQNIPADVIPWSTPVLRHRKDALLIVADPTYADSVLEKENARAAASIGRDLMVFRKFDTASRFLQKAYDENPTNPETVGMLVQAYELSGNNEQAMATLQKWVDLNPQDTGAKNMLNGIKNRSKVDDPSQNN